MSPSSSSSSSSDSESSSSDSEERRRRRKRKHKKEKREKERREKKKRHREKKKDRHKHKKDKNDKKDKKPVERSIITGKRIKLEREEDAEGEARRSALLAHFNEGEDEDVVNGYASRVPQAASASSSLAARAQQAFSDPAVMRQLMQQSHEAQIAKRARLTNLQRSANTSVGAGGHASVGDEFGAHFLGDSTTGKNERPRNYKQERAEKERAGD